VPMPWYSPSLNLPSNLEPFWKTIIPGPFSQSPLIQPSSFENDILAANRIGSMRRIIRVFFINPPVWLIKSEDLHPLRHAESWLLCRYEENDLTIIYYAGRCLKGCLPQIDSLPHLSLASKTCNSCKWEICYWSLLVHLYRNQKYYQQTSMLCHPVNRDVRHQACFPEQRDKRYGPLFSVCLGQSRIS